MCVVFGVGGGCGVVVEFVVEFVVDVVVVVPVVAPSGRGDAVASPRPSVAHPRPRWGPTNASAWRPATVRMNTCCCRGSEHLIVSPLRI